MSNKIYMQTKRQLRREQQSGYARGLADAAANGPAVWDEQIEYAAAKGYVGLRHMLECVTGWSADRIAGYCDEAAGNA